jgi:hypothetical protein
MTLIAVSQMYQFCTKKLRIGDELSALGGWHERNRGGRNASKPPQLKVQLNKKA